MQNATGKKYEVRVLLPKGVIQIVSSLYISRNAANSFDNIDKNMEL
jgi:hypothetical protein